LTPTPMRKPVTVEGWLESHPYLGGLGRLAAAVDAAAAGIEIPRAAIPDWAAYENDFRAGVPLLESPNARIDLEPVGNLAAALAERFAAVSPDIAAGENASRAAAELRREPGLSRRFGAWLLWWTELTVSSPGLLRFAGWSAMSRYLAPVVAAFAGWRDEERWLRADCPTCGSPPAMAQLIGAETGRVRFFSCGACRTRWRYGRTGCPFCGNDQQKLAAVAVEGEGGLRIDYCEGCSGYLKTYDGLGNEDLFLADWTSLHLDFAARDRGLQRKAASLFDLEPALLQPAG
jgi:FdhE protein